MNRLSMNGGSRLSPLEVGRDGVLQCVASNFQPPFLPAFHVFESPETFRDVWVLVFV